MGANEFARGSTTVVAAEPGIEATRELLPDGVRAADDDVYQRVGGLARMLHDALRELGYDRMLEDARDQIPVARDRLGYIARLTGDAAEKVLDGVDRARIVQNELAQSAVALHARWEAVAAHGESNGRDYTPAGRHLVDETCRVFGEVGRGVEHIQSILTDIMVAQDFHDLTGQVIRKVVALADTLEEQLLRLLIDAKPIAQRLGTDLPKLQGPAVDAEGHPDAATDQAGVDDLLASLGF